MNHHLKCHNMVIGGAVDVVIILILLFSVILGFFRGIIGETLRFFCWIGATWATYYTYFHFPSPLHQFDPLVIISVLFIGFLILFKLLQFIIEQIVKKKGIKIIDQPLGLAFGALRAIALIFLFKPMLETFKVESKFLAYAQNHLNAYSSIKKAEAYLQEKLNEVMNKMDKEFKKTAETKAPSPSQPHP